MVRLTSASVRPSPQTAPESLPQWPATSPIRGRGRAVGVGNPLSSNGVNSIGAGSTRPPKALAMIPIGIQAVKTVARIAPIVRTFNTWRTNPNHPPSGV